MLILPWSQGHFFHHSRFELSRKAFVFVFVFVFLFVIVGQYDDTLVAPIQKLKIWFIELPVLLRKKSEKKVFCCFCELSKYHFRVNIDFVNLASPDFHICNAFVNGGDPRSTLPGFDKIGEQHFKTWSTSARLETLYISAFQKNEFIGVTMGNAKGYFHRVYKWIWSVSVCLSVITSNMIIISARRLHRPL